MTNLDRIPRYAFEAGFRIALIPSESINIKIVGNGFEARETSEIVHEEYDISWKDVSKLEDVMSLSGHDFVRAKLISKENYRASAKNRLDFLVDACGFPAHLVLDFLPMTEYSRVGEATEEKILKIALKDVSEPKIIYGEIIGGHVKTWEHSYNTPMYWY
ncbi:hypothetical protein IJ103_03890 [Candidatus Saccharibacteria bacterium]|nr:hypothetical protein [Candidatus Saccharibacteria bacterium]MBQ9017348.1 hypothetical protein [Candidatus Saccharibacteria bacterium]